MEFLRFGSSIPGSYWGCCAVDIIQNFQKDPDDKASIQLVSGDGGGPITEGGEALFAGPTYRDIFWQRLRVGTFDKTDMPNHAFLAILTENQIGGSVGKKWLAILKEAGFEFIRSVSNSVYGGKKVAEALSGPGFHLNHIFGLFRNIGSGGSQNPFIPPQAWRDLPSVKPEAWEYLSLCDGLGLAARQFAEDKAIWEKTGPASFLRESDLLPIGVPITLAGLRSLNPQESKEGREARNPKKASLSPFG